MGGRVIFKLGASGYNNMKILPENIITCFYNHKNTQSHKTKQNKTQSSHFTLIRVLYDNSSHKRKFKSNDNNLENAVTAQQKHWLQWHLFYERVKDEIRQFTWGTRSRLKRDHTSRTLYYLNSHRWGINNKNATCLFSQRKTKHSK